MSATTEQEAVPSRSPVWLIKGETTMKILRLLIVLTLVNLALLVFTIAQMRRAVAESVPPVLLGRALEIVDDQGRVRASLNVLPAKKQPNGDTYPETVLLRLITERGRPSVKISASEQAAGLGFAGPTGTKDTYVILESKDNASSLKLKNEDGREQIQTLTWDRNNCRSPLRGNVVRRKITIVIPKGQTLPAVFLILAKGQQRIADDISSE